MPDGQQPMIDRVAALHPDGAHAAVSSVVAEFYRRILADDDIAPYFIDTDIRRQQQRITDALVLALDGNQPRYHSIDHLRSRLRASHRRLGITDDHYDRVVGYLAQTMHDAGVPAEVHARVAETAAAVRGDIVGHHSDPAGISMPGAPRPGGFRGLITRIRDTIRDTFAAW